MISCLVCWILIDRSPQHYPQQARQKCPRRNKRPGFLHPSTSKVHPVHSFSFLHPRISNCSEASIVIQSVAWSKQRRKVLASRSVGYGNLHRKTGCTTFNRGMSLTPSLYLSTCFPTAVFSPAPQPTPTPHNSDRHATAANITLPSAIFLSFSLPESTTRLFTTRGQGQKHLGRFTRPKPGTDVFRWGIL